MLKVCLVAHTPMPEQLVAASAKMCYSSADTETIMNGLTEESCREFLRMLNEIGHESPVEHVSFTFAVEGVSRSLLAQLTRHRIASFSVQSQRYVKEDNFTYVVPPEIEGIPEAKARFEAAMEADRQAYRELSRILYEKHLKELLEEGEEEKSASGKARKTAIEDARFVLPNACETKLMMTMNVRSLRHFFALRCCNRAQWEIRELAWRMLFLCRDAAPMLFENAGPGCLRGTCPEGKMSCGKAEQVRARSKAHE